MESAIAPLPEPLLAPPLAMAPRGARAAVWRALWSSRLVVFCSGVLAVLAFGFPNGWQGYDPTGLTSPFGYFGNLLVAPFARWDSVWYLAIARGGYGHQQARTAFFPLFPLVTRGLGIVIGSDLIAGIAISMAMFVVALLLLYRLTSLELDAARAELAVMLIAFCPMAYFFSAVYSESLYLALSVGCVLQARRGRWWAAGVLGALAAASRNSGIVLAVPVALMFFYGPREDRPLPSSRWAQRIAAGTSAADGAAGRGRPLGARARRWGWQLVPRHRLSPQVLWLALIPAGLGAYILYLQLSTGNPLAPFHSEAVWYREFAGPFGGVKDGAVAAWDGLRQLLHGPPPPVYFTKAGGNQLTVAGQNLMLFAFLVLGAVAVLGVLRRLPFAYGAYAVASLAVPLSYPVTPQPLASLPRYEVVLFPMFMWGAIWISRRRLVTPAIASLAVLLGLFTAEFATWRFVA
jgi:Mannosyltransferase (PIG-V)